MLKRQPIAIEEAVSRVMKHAAPIVTEGVPLLDSGGRVLGEAIIADHPVPPFDRSPYDGFAIRAADTQHAKTATPAVLLVIGEIGAGKVFPQPVKEMECVRIMTGAAIPEGCNAVVKLEDVKELTVNRKPYIQIQHRVLKDSNISFQGEDLKKGSVLLETGEDIGPGTIGLLATFGYARVPVRKRPRIGIIATGSELLDIKDALQPGKIRNSNGYMIYAQVIRAGGEPVYLGKLEDDVDSSLKRMSSSLGEVDVLVTTGGVSVGDYDYMPEILKRLGANVLFNKIAMRPGSVTTAAEIDGKLLFALSGNPSACYVGFELLARPFIRGLLGAKKVFPESVTAVLAADYPKKNPVDRFVRGRVSEENGRLFAAPTGLDKSGSVSSLKQANALLFFPAGTNGYQKGMKVQTVLLDCF